MIRALFTGRYLQTDHNVFLEVPFNKCSHYIGTSQFIYIGNSPVFLRHKTIEKHFWTYTTVCSLIHFIKNRATEKPANLCLRIISWLDFVWYELTLKGISKQTLSRGHILVELSLLQLFKSHWHNASTVTGMIVRQWLAWFFNSQWHDCSTVTGTIMQQRLVRLFNSNWHDSSTVAGTIFFFFLYWHNSSAVMFTVEESCHVPGIRQMIPWFHFTNWFYQNELIECFLTHLKVIVDKEVVL